MRDTNRSIDGIIREIEDTGQYGGVSPLTHIWLYCLREKAIFENLNKMEVGNKFISGYFWGTHSDKEELMDQFMILSQTKPHFIGVDIKKITTDMLPPSRFSKTDVLYPSQLIVNTYGVPRYKELNPAVFTVASFPFLFGVMFGDIGHGAILLSFAILVLFSKTTNSSTNFVSDAISATYPYRYLFLSMGLFAVYSGLIYNEFFGMSLPLFYSCYKRLAKRFVKKAHECVYPLGIDTVWSLSSNEIAYLNSFKMKFSIITGVCQMTLGICLKGLNSLYLSDWATLLLEFVPQLLFFTCTFGYLVMLIVAKWSIDWQAEGAPVPPSLINTMINFVSQVSFYYQVDVPVFGDSQGVQQLWTQRILAGTFRSPGVAVLSVPVMLFGKPLVFALRAQPRKYVHMLPVKKVELSNEDGFFDTHMSFASNSLFYEEDSEEVERLNKRLGVNSPKASGEGAAKGDDHTDSFGEVFVHQTIETIEFVLGSVSNTASYLRLWALSLAHRQLSVVFYEMLVLPSLSKRDSVMGALLSISLCFSLFMIITFGVLMLMDLLECFLHSLRLHWYYIVTLGWNFRTSFSKVMAIFSILLTYTQSQSLLSQVYNYFHCLL
jgi:V-type H+-transporting ATPase subunit a